MVIETTFDRSRNIHRINLETTSVLSSFAPLKLSNPYTKKEPFNYASRIPTRFDPFPDFARTSFTFFTFRIRLCPVIDPNYVPRDNSYLSPFVPIFDEDRSDRCSRSTSSFSVSLAHVPSLEKGTPFRRFDSKSSRDLLTSVERIGRIDVVRRRKEGQALSKLRALTAVRVVGRERGARMEPATIRVLASSRRSACGTCRGTI